MMQAVAETKVPPEHVWKAWAQAHGLQEPQKEFKLQGKFRYKIIEVKPGQQFSILWKTLFVRLIFTYGVQPLYTGAQISYQVEIRGLFAKVVKWMIGAKIRKDLGVVLKTMVAQLEGRVVAK